MGYFRYDLNNRYDVAYIEMWNDNQLVHRLWFDRLQLEGWLDELKHARTVLGNQSYRDPRTGVYLNLEQLNGHIAQLHRLSVLLRSKPYIDPQTGVNLEAPSTARQSPSRETGLARGGDGNISIDPAWQGFDPGGDAGGRGAV
jgi:hypothetical protein